MGPHFLTYNPITRGKRACMTTKPLVMHLWILFVLVLSLTGAAIPAFAQGNSQPVVEGTQLLGSQAQINGIPDQPSVVSPPDGALNVATDPLLQVRVTDPDLDSLNVTYFGREVRLGPASDFAIIVLPDTQRYSDANPALFAVQTQWIVDSRAALNIVYVAHVGDIVNDAKVEQQWRNADAALSLLEDPATTGHPDGIPYSVVPGNHDVPGRFYEKYFGVKRFQGRSYYGEGYPDGSNKNNYTLFSGGGMDFIAIGIDYEGVDPGALDWADGLLKAHSDRRAIVVSHHILEEDGSFGNWGQRVYDALKDNPNLFLMLAGHRHAEASRTEVYEGQTVYALMADYQSYPKGGQAFLRRLEFSPENSQIRVSTYSPWLDQYETDADSQFVLDYDMTGGEPYQQLGTVSGVASGSEVSLHWPGRAPGTAYEWYVRVSDGTDTTTGPAWAFATEGAGLYKLTTAAVGSGSVTWDPHQWAYRHGDVVQLIAQPAEGHTFLSWSGDLSSDANPATIVMDSHKSVLAHFVPVEAIHAVYLPLISRNTP